MDLWTRTSGCVTWRLPRARGDGPGLRYCFIAPVLSPPRTRGWTHLLPYPLAVAGVSPAHAGMDLLSMTAPYSLEGLPRARGDGPTWLPYLHSAHRSPPRTRGWTRYTRKKPVADPVSPAHAGMDLQGLPFPCLVKGLPRARGDGPKVLGLADSLDLSPPRTRGWTYPFRPPYVIIPVSPAHAGMDLSEKKRRLS